MKKLALLVMVFVLSSCATSRRNTVGSLGGLFTSTTNEIAVKNDKVPSKKKGKSCTRSILGLVNWGDNSSSTAMKNGKIKRISFIHDESLSVLGIYAHSCTVVQGI